MSCHVQIRQEYRLPEAERQKIISQLIPAIWYHQGIVPKSISCQIAMRLIELQNRKVWRQRMKFIKRFGNDGVEMPSQF